MTKYIFVVFLFFFPAILLAQDNIISQDSSQNRPSISINFSWEDDTLINVIQKLSHEQGIKFSYSADLLKKYFLKGHIFFNTPLNNILDTLLLNTDLSYVAIGKVIVIKRSQVKLFPVDTVSAVVNNVALPDTSSKNRKFYISMAAGLVLYNSKLNSLVNFDFQKELLLKYEATPGFYSQLMVGLQAGNFSVRSGLSFQSLNINGNWEWKEVVGGGKKTKPTLPPPSQGNRKLPAPSADSKYYFSDNYFLSSLPVGVFYYKKRKNIFAEIGGGLKLSFTHIKSVVEYKFYDYYLDKFPDASYSEKTHRFSTSYFTEIQAGYEMKKMAISGGVEYNKYFTSLVKNPLFKYHPNSFIFKIAFKYYLK